VNTLLQAMAWLYCQDKINIKNVFTKYAFALKSLIRVHFTMIKIIRLGSLLPSRKYSTEVHVATNQCIDIAK